MWLDTVEYGGGLLLFSNEQFNQIDTTDNTSVDESNQKIDGGVNQNG